MLPAACIHIVEDGIGLENKSRRQGAAPFTLICNLHKIVDTIPYNRSSRHNICLTDSFVNVLNLF